MTAHLRIETQDLVGQNSRVIYVDNDGTETDISSVVRSVDASLRVGEINTARLECTKVMWQIDARLDGLLVKELRRRRFTPRRLRDVTSLGVGWREWVRG